MIFFSCTGNNGTVHFLIYLNILQGHGQRKHITFSFGAKTWRLTQVYEEELPRIKGSKRSKESNQPRAHLLHSTFHVSTVWPRFSRSAALTQAGLTESGSTDSNRLHSAIQGWIAEGHSEIFTTFVMSLLIILSRNHDWNIYKNDCTNVESAQGIQKLACESTCELFSGCDVMLCVFSETFPWINAEREVWI